MTREQDESCGCGTPPHPALPLIPAGLSALVERQRAGFPEYREALLSAIPSKAPLSAWRARGAGDLGVMLLEAWAYVLDVTGFYDARIAERGFLGTAPDAASARRLTALLGHRPRPAMAARVQLAAEADEADPVTLPEGTAFRSEPFDDEPPQVFELAEETVIWPQRNRWELAPLREDAFAGTLRFLPRRAPEAGAVVVLWSAFGQAAAARIAAIETETAVDGARYLRAELEAGSETGLDTLMNEQLSDLNVAIARLPLAMTGFSEITVDGQSVGSFVDTSADDTSSVVLDALYPQVRPGARAVAEIGDQLHPVLVETVAQAQIVIDSTSGATQHATRVTFSPTLTLAEGVAFTLHADPRPLGSPTRPAKTEIELSDIQMGGALSAPVAELGDAPASGDAILRGARKKGELVSGMVVENGEGGAQFLPDGATDPFTAPLAIPIALYGNVVEAVRGETVIDEVLGSGNAAMPFNRFTLKKHPLTWVEDASQADGRRPELTVGVDNIEWQRVDSFFGRESDERIYVVRQEPDGGATVEFGDGLRGQRVPTGVDNVRADYRYGAGAAKPPAGSINQIAVPVPGLATVRGPLPATGGADPETPDELRETAPAGALTLGRAVSLADLQALAQSFPGVLNAAAEWAWDERRQRAAAKLWIIADGGDPSDELANWVAAQALPDLAIVVEEAGTAASTTLAITLEIEAGHHPEMVRAAALQALFDPKTGLLAPANVEIGRPLFRSALTHRLHEVAGVKSVVSILLDGLAMPHAVGPGSGNWFDLEAGTTVS